MQVVTNTACILEGLSKTILDLGPHRIPSTSGVLFALVFSDYLSTHPSPDGLLYQLWYLDVGALVGSHPALATFFNVTVWDLACVQIFVNVRSFGPQASRISPNFQLQFRGWYSLTPVVQSF